MPPSRSRPDVANSSPGDTPELDGLHEIGSRLAAADPLEDVLLRVVHFVTAIIRCDSCLVYVVEGPDLVLRASKNPHPDVVNRLRIRLGQGITGWVAEHRRPVAVRERAFEDSRFRLYAELPEDRYEAFLSVPVISRGRLVGVINVQHRQPHHHRPRTVRLIATIGFLVGAEIELARLQVENSLLSEQLEERKLVDRAKGILQRELGVSEQEAYLMIQKQSRQHRRTKRDIAEAVIIGDDVRRSQTGD